MRTIICRSFITATSGILTIICRRLIWRTRTSEAKGQSLDLTKNRMANQQTTMEELKSTNEDRDLSEIIIDYTSAYTAYRASLQAAAKINQTTLLNYI